MSKHNQDVLAELYRATKDALTKKLRQSRLAPLMRDGVMTGFEEPAFVERFGAHLDKVEDADIAALTLYLPPQDSLIISLGKLAGHMSAAPEGKTGLPYFDDWKPTDDSPAAEVPVEWAHSYQEEPRKLLTLGYRIGKNKPSADGSPGVFVSILVAR